MCVFIVSKALLISSATVTVRAVEPFGWRSGAIWLNPFATVLLNVYSAVTVSVLGFVPVLRGCVLVFYNIIDHSIEWNAPLY